MTTPHELYNKNKAWIRQKLEHKLKDNFSNVTMVGIGWTGDCCLLTIYIKPDTPLEEKTHLKDYTKEKIPLWTNNNMFCDVRIASPARP